jgi:hypothetical protein
MCDTGRFADVSHEVIDAVSGPSELAAVIQVMLDDFSTGGGEWENGTLPRYLESLGAYIEAHFDRSDDRRRELTWFNLANALVAASGYE